jgi:hypothetical protein
MKSKNLILALVAIVFAVGSAFTSVDLVSPVKIRYQQIQNGAWACQTVSRNCTNESDGVTCTIDVLLSSGATKAAKARDNEDCPTILKHKGTMPAAFNFATAPFDVD